MGSTTQRKGWNDAMQSAGSLTIPRSSTLSRTSNRKKKQGRRERARKINHVQDVLMGGSLHTAEIETIEYRSAARLDALEGVTNVEDGENIDQEEYNELEELDINNNGGRKRRSGGSKRKASIGVGHTPKRFKQRSLASILIEEVSWVENGVSQKYVAAEAKPNLEKYHKLPRRKFCPVTGLEGLYTDPKTRVPYANLLALEQIKERIPSWMNSSEATGLASYFEAIKSLRDAN
mmetsp:Transcript_16936/g.23966  ORF Transcript_16936/g.23966 Transcript_16936/m.23966 type:complete len:234 (-) Transcript_16936:260-961(-)|eukprot:CAMPEP_0184869602 /NCGR_PEP_ID=MMETSP0580-20130426/34672_1 /TAXON_ID=1118495 /ORGANISM="Dactyliosolen fragilissimus" /LENGTH=233 /DNA_ID=CAMNT_0027371187 /DNA_START=46 /DNA_END=747 /DNA_ORIENTATION=-